MSARRRISLLSALAAAMLAAAVSCPAQTNGAAGAPSSPQERVARTQELLVLRQSALARLQSVSAAAARDPSDSTRRLLDEARRLIRSGEERLASEDFSLARTEFERANQILLQAFASVGPALGPPRLTADVESAATLRRRQEETDRRRLVEAESLLHRVRSAAARSPDARVRQNFEKMQDNLLRVRRELTTSPTARFSIDLPPPESSQARPLLDETIQLGRTTLALVEDRSRLDRDLEQAKGRYRRVRDEVEAASDPQVRDLMRQAEQRVRQGEELAARGEVAQARAEVDAAEDLVLEARELAAERSVSAAGETTSARVRTGLDSINGHLVRARRQIGATTDPVAARLLVQAESSYQRAEELHRQGRDRQSLSLLKLVGRLLKNAYQRAESGS